MELDTVSGASIDADVFKTKLKQVLLRNRDRTGGERRLSAIAPLGGGTRLSCCPFHICMYIHYMVSMLLSPNTFHITVSIVELAKVWRDAFDASTAQAAPTPVRAPRERKQEIDSVYVGGGCVGCL